jgi:hypothetical protein
MLVAAIKEFVRDPTPGNRAKVLREGCVRLCGFV